MARRHGGRTKEDSERPGNSGFMKGLADVLDKLSELAEKGRELSKSGEFGADKELKGVYGFNLRVGVGDKAVRVEPFGNMKIDPRSGKAVVVEEVREPAVDVFEEADRILVVAEMPGVAAADVKLELTDDVLAISAARGDKKYRKEVLLPRACSASKMTLTCNNGIVEISCPIE